MLDVKITSDNLIQYTRTDNAHEAFNTAVDNGQARLALEILVDLINGMAEIITSLEEKVLSIPKDNEVVDSAPKQKTRALKTEKESVDEEVLAEA